jgi:hypothetical protein
MSRASLSEVTCSLQMDLRMESYSWRAWHFDLRVNVSAAEHIYSHCVFSVIAGSAPQDCCVFFRVED